MNALPQPKTHQIVDRINALQAASPRFIDTSEITPLSREWSAIRHDIDQLMRVDACAAWELTGSWRALTGDVEGAEAAFTNSVALGHTGVNRENWMITRLNLGLFSGAQGLFRELCVARNRNLAEIARCGFLAGAIGRTAELIEGARNTGVELDDAWSEQVMEARSIMTDANVTDEDIGNRLDCGGVVLRRHGYQAVIVPHVLSVEGVCRTVSYRLLVPLPFEPAHNMTYEMIPEEEKLERFDLNALAVWIEGGRL
ncbi:hypothetical protein AWB75_01255 [Caballeronia catudaia]|uniref:Uncharacterized protein n=1 Tax=Caballeronia catudaia TaxID=1777136 RepID=A0A157ZV09_9BURK|nr:hypothetical protein [Caballeronia catudaia]SAK49394.1 hypothetical protein AWB75_01255 [Caballeronia catudaia]